MARKIFVSGPEARKSLIAGAMKMAEAVKSTLGPFGLNATLEKNNEVTNDGVTIAREIVSGGIFDEVEARGARMLLEATTKTEDQAGDGTTTATVLAQAILEEASKYLGDDTTISRKRPSEIINQIEKERIEINEHLISMATSVDTEEKLINSALVSTGDKELSTLIGSAQFKLGKDGVINVEESADKVSSIEESHGIKIDNGLGTTLVMNNQEKQSLEINESCILLTDYVLARFDKLIPLIENLAQNGYKSLVVMARAFNQDTVQRIITSNNLPNSFQIFPINAPYVDQKEIMMDLSAVTGARFISQENSLLDKVTIKDVGFISKISARRYDAIITGKEDDQTKERVTKRVEELHQKLEGSKSEFEKTMLEARIAQLTHGFATLKVGAITEIRRKFLKRKADDAVVAVRGAFQEGVVPGAGLAFKIISDSLPKDYILKEPLLSIHTQIIKTSPPNFKIEKWVVDPVKVLRIALENACSVASTFATSSIVVTTEQPKPLDVLLKKSVASQDQEGI